MKKLMVALAAVALAGVTQAAALNWTYDIDTVYNAYDDGSTKLAGATYYFLVDTSSANVNALKAAALSDLRDGKGVSGYAQTGKLDANGKLEGVEYTNGGDPSKIYAALIITSTDAAGNDWMMMTANKNGTGLETGATALSFTYSSTIKATDLETKGTAAGWYMTKAVPEPTSAMLLLLGVAGLALRRRRA